MDKTETIISHLIADRDFAEKYLPHIDPSNYEHQTDYQFPYQHLFSIIKSYYEKCPKAKDVPKDVLHIEIKNLHPRLNGEQFAAAKKFIDELPLSNGVDRGFLDRLIEHDIREHEGFSLLYRALDATKRNDFKQLKTYYQKGLQVCEETFSKEPHYRSVYEMIQDYKASTYLIDGLFKRGWVYAITGPTGTGKTAVGLLLALIVASGVLLGDRKVIKGNVVYFAGENPDDIIERCDALLKDTNPDMMASWNICPRAGREAAEAAIQDFIKDGKEIALVVVDTASSYRPAGDDENDNIQATNHANWLRSIAERVPGHPTVVALCHPSLAAKQTNDFVPRGGSNFMNTIDGNVMCFRVGNITLLKKHPEKFRGVDFDPISFLREKRLVKGNMPTVIARFCSEEEAALVETKNSTEEMDVLRLLPMPVRKIADRLGWYKSKTERMIKTLRRKQLIDESNELTSLGRETIGKTTTKPLEGVI